MSKVTILDIVQKKASGDKITMLTAYDCPFSVLLDKAGIDILLVGDSVGSVVLGYENTLPVTMEEVIYHTRAVVRGRSNALVVGDMPFMSYQTSVEDAIKNAGRLVKEGGAEAIKLEGGKTMEETISAITNIDIPVMGHIGLTPQSIHRMGGHRVQGREERERRKLLEDARALERAGAFAVVLECIPENLAREITSSISVPTIGIGAGIHCDGQVLVIHDLLGLLEEKRPKFVKEYISLRDQIQTAVGKFISEVKEGRFPDEGHSYK